MADHEIGNPYGVQEVNGNNRSGTLVNPNLASIAAMKTRLQAVDATFYTDEKLHSMAHNDLVYAVRLEDENGIK